MKELKLFLRQFHVDHPSDNNIETAELGRLCYSVNRKDWLKTEGTQCHIRCKNCHKKMICGDTKTKDKHYTREELWEMSTQTAVQAVMPDGKKKKKG